MNGKEWILPVIACILAVLVAAGVGVRLLQDTRTIRTGVDVVSELSE